MPPEVWRGDFLDGAALAAQVLERNDAAGKLETAWLGAPSLTRLLRWLLAETPSPAALKKRAAAALKASPDVVTTDAAALERWVAALPEVEKTSLLVRLVGGADVHLRAELLRRFRASLAFEVSPVKTEPCTAGELLDAAEKRAEERRRQKAEHAAREKARREREAAEARDRHLAALAARETEAWRELDALIATKQPKKYDEAVTLLRDLRDVCVRGGRQVVAATRLAPLDLHTIGSSRTFIRSSPAALFARSPSSAARPEPHGMRERGSIHRGIAVVLSAGEWYPWDDDWVLRSALPTA